MARATDVILGGKAYGRGRGAPMVDLKNGGQFGWMTDYPSYISNSAYVRRNLIARLIEAPAGFNDLPEPQVWRETLKALVELHPKTIEGLQMQLNVEFQSNPFGGAGEEQEDPTNVTRTRSTPSFTYTERYGRPINAFFRSWITELIMDPITKFPNVITRTGNTKPSDLLPDYTGMTVLFFEPDPTHQKVDKAWLCTNMMPKTDGAVEGRREPTAAGSGQDVTIEFTSITQVGVGVDQLAQKLLTQMNLVGANPNHRPAFMSDISPLVNSSAINKGYAEQIAAAAASAVQV